MASHPLDNPVWNALAGPQASLGIANGRFRRYADDFALFAAVENPADGFEGLAEALPAGTIQGLVALHPAAIPSGMELLETANVSQMVATRPRLGDASMPIRELGVADVPAMMELTALTHPGPFFVRTIEMGRYWGVLEGERVVGMAGERMRIPGFVEISAVCTHPEHRGRGYAKALVSAVARGIVAGGGTPFLHVRAGNTVAISTYEKLGFAVRETMAFTVVRRV